ncbi:MAG TPA: sigma-70 family RNA polymerase sigma factor [Solirubrobacteraceae bacterium]|nr:sigma-70 family RNA polymerase sigma factor [Solirubrobacteraceae bacterium]
MAHGENGDVALRATERALWEINVARECRRRGAPAPASGELQRRAQRAREELVRRYTPLARSLAARHVTPAERFEDLLQVALLALLQAIERFDPTRGTPFTAYAAPSIGGELKRHLRDNTWALHVPRPARERSLELWRVSAALADAPHGEQELRAQLAQALAVSEEELRDLRCAASAYLALPLEGAGRCGEGFEEERLGGEDQALRGVEAASRLRWLLCALRPREREVVFLRFVYELSQSEIASLLGISQMHVSRLLRASLARLRERAHSEEGDPRAGAGGVPKGSQWA